MARTPNANHAQEDRSAAEKRSREVLTRLRARTLLAAAELVQMDGREALAYHAYPAHPWRL